ncbi:alpha/beta fold hydrolase [Streptomyces alkaliphilus]|uniref:Alpha/beta fold hydrolase n=1 Tax=Streptomyces alkaliphilus TaxID=1472722 RepID=A0A7W3Y130_9ACTN|nr:alpha/beta fold hydrolase [Streptomyces alkaliphilus]MBB0243897.1 alpha/beta fold hydrolase [Streptomyces alkaliphilus]
MGALDVPGATLHYEVHGSGPVLLLLPGGGADAGMYAGMTTHLTTRYTTVSLDPRGLSRSRLHRPLTEGEDHEVTVWSEDVRRLLDAVAPGEEAYVLGCSAGAIVALDLLARHPERLRRVVAHEPPLLDLLPDPAPHRALFAEVRELSRTDGPAAAMARFTAGLGEEGDDPSGDPSGAPSGDGNPEPPPALREMAPRMHANMPVFLEHVLCPFTSRPPNLDALRPVAHKLVPAVGRASRGQEALHRPVVRLAATLGIDHAEFPGGHLGAVETPDAFTARLIEVLD